MTKADILAELPKLRAEERRQVFECLCELQEQDLLHGDAAPTPEEARLLDQALAEYERDRNPGTPWRDVLRQIRSSEPR